MSLKQIDLIKNLIEIPGVSGYEELVSSFISSYLKKYTDDVYVDKLYNVAVIFEGEPGYPKIMITSHMDEIGLIVRRIDSNGFIRVTRVGGIDARALISREVRIVTDENKEIYGVVGIKSHHLIMSPEERDKVPSWNELYIDIGASSYSEVRELGIDIGNQVTYAPNFRILNNKLIVTKTVDNRVLNYVLLMLADLISRDRLMPTVILAFTVQEEFNQRGSIPLVRRFKPDILINTDIAVATDTPETLQEASPIALGKGPVISIYSFHGRGMLAGLISHPKLRRFVEKIANEYSIDIQKNVTLGVVSEAAHLYLESENGIPSIDLGLPCRYTHYPNETTSISDISSLINLIYNTITNIRDKIL